MEDLTLEESAIDYFAIYGMHGYKDIKLDFSCPFNILLSENGQGKTTIIKLINAVFNGHIEKLKEIRFQSIEVKFKKFKRSIILKQEDLDLEWESRAYKHIKSRVDEQTFDKVLNSVIKSKSYKSLMAEVRAIFPELHRGVRNTGSSLPFSTMALQELHEEKNFVSSKTSHLEFFKIIKERSPFKTLYLPTYRRIEDLIATLSEDEKISTNEHIKFGLSDVEATIESIKKEILTSCNDSTSRTNGEILSRLANGLSLTIKDREIITKNIDSLSLVLNRFGKSLTAADKELITKKVKSHEEFNDERNDTLVYFLSKMYSTFNEQREKDQALSKFAKVCSKYFKNKEMEYDEATLEVQIKSLDTNEEIEFEHLSSGEKQIVSLFSKLILEKEKNLFVLFDEPELSLSVEWQKMLLTDVLNSGSCKMLLAMTHSPFIMHGLTNYASDLKSSFINGTSA
ncbi:putative ATP-binding protein involved in virulence [Pseudomonas sp. GM21]|uniref:AAA family ATPase n=1 Tax=Pseudomonas sp. GM21 TaxID=1144325 RepID=UPI00027229BF|nr:AAA family ATPase [Pseudomonas sp. GM21]EJM10596.1 putative ATP-binding protein involved in virulence [Pseudomonas sp. GM21]